MVKNRIPCKQSSWSTPFVVLNIFIVFEYAEKLNNTLIANDSAYTNNLMGFIYSFIVFLNLISYFFWGYL